MAELRNINNSFRSYQKLITFYEENRGKQFEDIHLELRQWFAANMTAALGAILDNVTKLNNIRLNHIDNNIKKILSKNEFLSYFGIKRIPDSYHSTIKYQKLKPTDGKFFKAYVIDNLLDRDELPGMSKALKTKMVEAIYEIFVNAQMHSACDSIYTCGQYFHKKNKIEFTIVDNGIGFKEKINRHFNENLDAEKAIRWAVRDKNTTKSVSGGIGLALLREFISLNDGKMQIISDEAYYEYSAKSCYTQRFNGSFPGTIVNLQFRTDDNTEYFLKSEEEDINDIF